MEYFLAVGTENDVTIANRMPEPSNHAKSWAVSGLANDYRYYADGDATEGTLEYFAKLYNYHKKELEGGTLYQIITHCVPGVPKVGGRPRYYYTLHKLTTLQTYYVTRNSLPCPPMFCSFCGCEVEDTDKYCCHCGGEL